MLLARLTSRPRSDMVEVRRRVLSALRARDADLAVQEMTNHLRRLSRQMKEEEKAHPRRGAALTVVHEDF